MTSRPYDLMKPRLSFFRVKTERKAIESLQGKWKYSRLLGMFKAIENFHGPLRL